MKTNRLLSFLAVLLLASLACNLGASAPADEGAPAPAGDGAAGEPASGDSNPPVDESAESPPADTGGEAGPETLDLSTLKLVTLDNFPAYTVEFTYVYAGVDSAGAPKEGTATMTSKSQTLPEAAEYFQMKSQAGETLETTAIGGQTYSVISGYGCSVMPPSEDTSPKNKLDVHGQAQRLEAGVEVNGYTTDKYLITKDNIPDTGDGSEWQDGFIYVVRGQNFVTRLEIQATAPFGMFGLDPQKPAELKITVNTIPEEDGSLDIAIPAACSDSVEAAGSYPVMEGATDQAVTPGAFFYKVANPPDEVLNFYRAEMANQGWQLTKDVAVGSFYTLNFEKDGKTVEVAIMKNGDQTIVNITEK